VVVGGGKRGEIIFTFVYWKESFKIKYLANFNQTWYTHFLHDGKIQVYSNEVQVLFKGG
jgi:hypothetical protein